MLAVLPSPNGRSVLIDDPLGSYLVWPLDGGKPMPVEGLTSEDKPIQWSPDGKFWTSADPRPPAAHPPLQPGQRGNDNSGRPLRLAIPPG